MLIAYVYEDTSDKDRIINAVFATMFMRIWAQYLNNNSMSKKYFITVNAFECLELNLIFLIKMIKCDKLQYIFLLSSQNNEAFFRSLRSFTGMESSAVNCSVKSFIMRVQKMQAEERLMYDFRENVKFHKLQSRENKKNRMKKEDLIEVEIEEYINTGMEKAFHECSKLGMDITDIDLEVILRIKDIVVDEEPQGEIEQENNCHNDYFEVNNLNSIVEDKGEDEIEDELEDLDELNTEDIQFSNQKTGIFSFQFNIT